MGLFSKKTFVGIDLGSHSLKVVQMERAGVGWKITRQGVAPTPPETMKDGVVIDHETLGATLKEVLRTAGITATSAHIAAAGASVFVRVVPFPKMPEAVLRKSIKYEASRYVPGSVEDSYIEFEILGPINETQMNVLIAAAPKDIVESRIRTCAAAGLEVESVDIEVFAMYRAMLETSPEFDPTDVALAMVDIGASSTTVSVLHNGVFVMNRSIPNGGRALTEVLKKRFKLEDEDAESGKSQLDLRKISDPEALAANPPLKVIQPQVDELVREIKRSLNYFQSQQTDNAEGKQVERLVLSGGGAKLTGLPEYLAEKLGLPVDSQGLYQNPRMMPSSVDSEDGLELAVASGLALRAYGKAA